MKPAYPVSEAKSEFSSFALAVSISPPVAAVPRGGDGRVCGHTRILLNDELQFQSRQQVTAGRI